MKATICIAGFALSASAALIPRQQCCFSLTASGGASGPVTQLDDGQNRVPNATNSGTSTGSDAQYCISSGAITDGNGRGCILTPPTSQFQCDTGASPSPGFSVSASGQLEYQGSSQFYACSASDTEDNIYITTSSAETNCHQISLSTNGQCVGSSGGGGASSADASASASPSTSGSNVATPPANSAPGASAPAGKSSAPATSAPAQSFAGQSSVAETPATHGSASTPVASAYSSVVVSSGPAESGSLSVPQQSTLATASQQTSTSSVAASVGSVQTSHPAAETSLPAPESSQSVPTTPQPSGQTSLPTVAASEASADTSQHAPASSQPAGETSQAPSSSAPSQSAPDYSQPQQQSSAPSISSPGAESSAPATPSSAAGSSQSTPAPSPSAAPGSSVPSNGGSSPATESTPAATNSVTQTYGGSSQVVSSAISTASVGTAAPPGSVASTAVTGTQPEGSSGTSGSGCQTALTGAYQTPHLIVPVSSSAPDSSYGTSYNGQINSTASTIFNFDIPLSYSGKQCSVIFLLPEKSQLETSDYSLSGSGGLTFSELSSAATEQTTWNTVPSEQSQLGTIDDVKPGNSYVITTQSCAAGQTESIEVSSTGDIALNFFEDWNPASLGLYITSC